MKSAGPIISHSIIDSTGIVRFTGGGSALFENAGVLYAVAP